MSLHSLFNSDSSEPGDAWEPRPAMRRRTTARQTGEPRRRGRRTHSARRQRALCVPIEIAIEALGRLVRVILRSGRLAAAPPLLVAGLGPRGESRGQFLPPGLLCVLQGETFPRDAGQAARGQQRRRTIRRQNGMVWPALPALDLPPRIPGALCHGLQCPCARGQRPAGAVRAKQAPRRKSRGTVPPPQHGRWAPGRRCGPMSRRHSPRQRAAGAGPPSVTR